MKNLEIHSGLNKKEIRDFLAVSLMQIFKQEYELKKEIIPYNENTPYMWEIEDTKANIKFLQNHLSLLQEKAAIIQIIKMCGWEENDVSDYTPQNLKYNHWMSFIGTKKETIEFLQNIKKTK